MPLINGKMYCEMCQVKVAEWHKKDSEFYVCSGCTHVWETHPRNMKNFEPYKATKKTRVRE